MGRMWSAQEASAWGVHGQDDEGFWGVEGDNIIIQTILSRDESDHFLTLKPALKPESSRAEPSPSRQPGPGSKLL